MAHRKEEPEIQSGSQLSALIKDHISKNYQNQLVFAGKMGVAQNTVTRWNTGELDPSTGPNAQALAEELGVAVEDLAKLGSISVRAASEVVLKAWEIAEAIAPLKM